MDTSRSAMGDNWIAFLGTIFGVNRLLCLLSDIQSPPSNAVRHIISTVLELPILREYITIGNPPN
jgi:hypothetical protein